MVLRFLTNTLQQPLSGLCHFKVLQKQTYSLSVKLKQLRGICLTLPQISEECLSALLLDFCPEVRSTQLHHHCFQSPALSIQRCSQHADITEKMEAGVFINWLMKRFSCKGVNIWKNLVRGSVPSSVQRVNWVTEMKQNCTCWMAVGLYYSDYIRPIQSWQNWNTAAHMSVLNEPLLL